MTLQGQWPEPWHEKDLCTACGKNAGWTQEYSGTLAYRGKGPLQGLKWSCNNCGYQYYTGFFDPEEAGGDE